MAGNANTVGGPFRQYAQNMAQIRFRIDTVQTAGVDQPVQQCTTLAAVIATEEHVIFLSETDSTKRSFRCVIVRLRQTVIHLNNRGRPTDSVHS